MSELRLRRGALLLACGLGGAASMAYEIVWVCLLRLRLGSNTTAVTITIAVFMLGLLAGALLSGSRSANIRHPARVYACLELGTAAYALVLPRLLPGTDALWMVGPVVGWTLRYTLSVALLLPPTIAMGTALPLLVRQTVLALDMADAEVSTIYGLNTLGAALGAAVGTALLLRLGIHLTTLAAVALSLLTTALLLLSHGGAAAALWIQEAAPPPPMVLPHLLPIVFASGCMSMAFELLWLRMFGLYLSPNYSLTLGFVLMCCLAGLGSGSLFYGRCAKGAHSVSWLLILAGLCGFLTYALPMWLGPNRLAESLAVASMALLLSNAAYGLLFPTYNKMGAHRIDILGRTVGCVTAALFLGNIAGSFAATYVLLPSVGLKWGMLLCSQLSLLLAGLLGRARPAAMVAVVVLAAAVLLPAHAVVPLADHEKLLFYREGFNESTAVIERENGSRCFTSRTLRRRVDACDVHFEIPILMHPHPARMLIIGFGTGTNSWRSLCVLPQLDLTTVEFDENQVLAASFFAANNHGVLANPNFHLVIGDGRTFLQMTSPGSYDIIAMDANLFHSPEVYTQEFTALARSRLAPGGLYCQKFPAQDVAEGVEAPTFESLLATFQSVFPQTSAWKVAPQFYLLVGATADGAIDRGGMRARLARGLRISRPASPPSESDIDREFADFMARFFAGPQQVVEMAHHAKIITDDTVVLDIR